MVRVDSKEIKMIRIATTRKAAPVELDIERIADLDVLEFDQAHVFGGGSSHTSAPVLGGSSHTSFVLR